MSTVTSIRKRFYPEIEAGGFSRVDGTVAFYQRVNALVGTRRGTSYMNWPSTETSFLASRKVVG